MRSFHAYIIPLAVALFATASPLLGHHQSAIYDRAHLTTVGGRVTQFNFVNPHTTIHLQVKEKSGETREWTAEVASPMMLRQVGWDKDTLRLGDTITIQGFRAKDGSRLLSVRKLILPNGKVLNQREK